MPNNTPNNISPSYSNQKHRVYHCNAKCCGVLLLNYFSIVGQKRKKNVWYSHSDPNTMGTRVKTSPIEREDTESSERKGDTEQNADRKALQRRRKKKNHNKKSLTCIENASSHQWKTFKQKSKVLEVGSAEEMSWYTKEGNASTREWKPISVTALQLDSNGAGWKAGRKGNNGYKTRKLFIAEWGKA